MGGGGLPWAFQIRSELLHVSLGIYRLAFSIRCVSSSFTHCSMQAVVSNKGPFGDFNSQLAWPRVQTSQRSAIGLLHAQCFGPVVSTYLSIMGRTMDGSSSGSDHALGSARTVPTTGRYDVDVS